MSSGYIRNPQKLLKILKLENSRFFYVRPPKIHIFYVLKIHQILSKIFDFSGARKSISWGRKFSKFLEIHFFVLKCQKNIYKHIDDSYKYPNSRLGSAVTHVGDSIPPGLRIGVQLECL